MHDFNKMSKSPPQLSFFTQKLLICECFENLKVRTNNAQVSSGSRENNISIKGETQKYFRFIIIAESDVRQNEKKGQQNNVMKIKLFALPETGFLDVCFLLQTTVTKHLWKCHVVASLSGRTTSVSTKISAV